MSDLSLIRNFSIIAHIDHGKSTLADRFIQRCGGLSEREMGERFWIPWTRSANADSRSRPRPHAELQGETAQVYHLNLIDTPGHVDFTYEVSRSLAACEGALLVVDARQGVEAQSVANCYTAIEQGLEVIPVLNKIDLPQPTPIASIDEIEDIIGIDATDAVHGSAKTGLGSTKSSSVGAQIPAPKGKLMIRCRR